MHLTYNITMFSILLVLMSAMVIPFFSQKSWGLNLRILGLNSMKSCRYCREIIWK